MLTYPTIITDRPALSLIPRPGASLRVTEVGIEVLVEALKGDRIVQLTEYTARRLEIEHGVKVPAERGADYILCGRQITVDSSSPTSPLRLYLTEIEYA